MKNIELSYDFFFLIETSTSLKSSEIKHPFRNRKGYVSIYKNWL